MVQVLIQSGFISSYMMWPHDKLKKIFVRPVNIYKLKTKYQLFFYKEGNNSISLTMIWTRTEMDCYIHSIHITFTVYLHALNKGIYLIISLSLHTHLSNIEHICLIYTYNYMNCISFWLVCPRNVFWWKTMDISHGYVTFRDEAFSVQTNLYVVISNSSSM